MASFNDSHNDITKMAASAKRLEPQTHGGSFGENLTKEKKTKNNKPLPVNNGMFDALIYMWTLLTVYLISSHCQFSKGTVSTIIIQPMVLFFS